MALEATKRRVFQKNREQTILFFDTTDPVSGNAISARALFGRRSRDLANEKKIVVSWATHIVA